MSLMVSLLIDRSQQREAFSTRSNRMLSNPNTILECVCVNVQWVVCVCVCVALMSTVAVCSQYKWAWPLVPKMSLLRPCLSVVMNIEGTSLYVILDESSKPAKSTAVCVAAHMETHTNAGHLRALPLSHMPPKDLASAAAQTHSNQRHTLK